MQFSPTSTTSSRKLPKTHLGGLLRMRVFNSSRLALTAWPSIQWYGQAISCRATTRLVRIRDGEARRRTPKHSDNRGPDFARIRAFLFCRKTAAATEQRLSCKSSFTSDVSMHTVAATDGVSGAGCARPATGIVQRDTTSDGMLAHGHNRSKANRVRIPYTTPYLVSSVGFRAAVYEAEGRTFESAKRAM